MITKAFSVPIANYVYNLLNYSNSCCRIKRWTMLCFKHLVMFCRLGDNTVIQHCLHIIWIEGCLY